jgi:excisionase family DNA binding protein
VGDIDLMDENELCEWLKISVMTAYRWRKDGMPYIKVGRLVRYDKEKVMAWLQTKAQN